jgi:plasmid stability protein
VLIKNSDRAAQLREAQWESVADQSSCEQLVALRSSPEVPRILIRQMDRAVVRKLRAKAAAEGVSVEEEARRILRRSLMGDVPTMPLVDFLRTMPDVEDDRIFRRHKRKPRKISSCMASCST